MSGRGVRAGLIPMLQEIQRAHGWLPPEELRGLAERTGVPEAEITSVASFYAAFRFRPAGKYEIKVCVGSACHVKGADSVYAAFSRHLGLSEGEDTDSSGVFTLSRVSCLGCCMMAPAVLIGSRVYGWVSPGDVAALLENFLKGEESGASAAGQVSPEDGDEVRICLCSSCAAGGSAAVHRRVKAEISKNGYRARVREVACTGMSYRTPLMQIASSDGMLYDYGGVSEHQVPAILAAHFSPQGAVRRMRGTLGRMIDRIYSPRTWKCACESDSPSAAEYTRPQVRIATQGAGEMPPLDIGSYRKSGGFEGYEKALSMPPDLIRREVEISGLRGRGGGGFPTARKWGFLAAREGEKFLVCNADEGDPGAFMDRMLLESFPFRVIEGMMIASLATGALRGKFYVREEYARAVEMLSKAIEICEREGLLPAANGFRLEIFTGAGAFVCGEETALIASLEGGRGEPRLRPPFPAESGFMGRPTLINNVETFANVAWIIRRGGAAFASIGTETSKGAKTFALAGKVRRGGLIEVPLGMPLSEILYGIGGGAAEGRRLKAVQIGGPSGGCVPESMFDMRADYEELKKAGAIMGSGGLVALDDRDCMVDIAAYFMRFIVTESCGKCSACRVGCFRMLEILDRLRTGRGTMEDLGELERLGAHIKAASLCGLGKTAPNPVLSALRHFRGEFEEHVRGRCPAGKCAALSKYVITDKCIGCTKCFQACASGAIEFEPFKVHSIDAEKCVRCGACRDVCPVGAVEVA